MLTQTIMGFGASNRIFTSKGYCFPDQLLPSASAENLIQIWDGEAFRDAKIFDEGYSTDLVQIELTTGQYLNCTPDNLMFVKDPEGTDSEGSVGSNALLVKRASELKVGDVFPDHALPAMTIKPRPRLSKIFAANEHDPSLFHGAEPAAKLAWLSHAIENNQFPPHFMPIPYCNDIIMLFQSIGVQAQRNRDYNVVEVTHNNTQLSRSWPIAEPVECSVKRLSLTHGDVWSLQSNTATIFIQGVCIGRATLPL